MTPEQAQAEALAQELVRRYPGIRGVYGSDYTLKELAPFLQSALHRVVAAERERCAKIAAMKMCLCGKPTGEAIAAAIREEPHRA